MRELGRVQREVFKALRDFKTYDAGRGFAPSWVWGSAAQTEKVLDALVKKGLVVKEGQIYRPRWEK